MLLLDRTLADLAMTPQVVSHALDRLQVPVETGSKGRASLIRVITLREPFNCDMPQILIFWYEDDIYLTATIRIIVSSNEYTLALPINATRFFFQSYVLAPGSPCG